LAIEEPAEAITWLDRPVSPWVCVTAWVVATALFFGVLAALGGIAIGDMVSTESGALTVAHGEPHCAFPADAHVEAPLYPLLAAGVLAVVRPGRSVPFPDGRAMAGNCDDSATAVRLWMARSHSVQDVAHVGLIAWFPLLAGFVSVVRAAGRGRRRAEVVGVMVLAVLPPVLATLHSFFHPEDLVAMGLILGSLAAGLRSRWLVAGVAVGLAVTAQPFALLAAVPLVVVAPSRLRLRVGLGGVIGVAVVAVPVALLTYHGLSNAFFSAGTYLPTSQTLIGLLHLPSSALGAVSRGGPVIGAALLAGWARHRLGDGVLRPDRLVAVVGTALGLRLITEVLFWGYYLAAVAVMLLVLDTVTGRLRVVTVAFFVLCGAFFPLVGEGSQLLNVAYNHLAVLQAVLVGWALVLLSGPLRTGWRSPAVTAST
jgi:hypothetical protein